MDGARYRALAEAAESIAARGEAGWQELRARDPELAAELERTLADGADFLATPAVDAERIADLVREALDPTPAPPTVPAVRIHRLLGRGAHADVWEGVESGPLARRVAVKVLADRGLVRRFELERVTLAGMSHPNVARVFAAGECDDGRPFLTMELLVGEPLLAACRSRHMRLRERVALYAKVCSAVQHAHDRGVVHRDLKPSNVLVVNEADEATPKVFDFGVAKALEREPADATRRDGTVVGQVVGTPDYMSPEQLSGRADAADTRSDVYSLGAMLFELLTGELPHRFADVGFLERAHLIGSRPPPRARDLAPSIDRDLDAVVGKALEPDPSRRYRSAGALAEDLERWLRSEPVKAKAPTVVRQARWFALRHRGLAAGAVAGLMLLVGLAVGATSLLVESQRENRRLKARAETTLDALAALADVAGSADARAALASLIRVEIDDLGGPGNDPELNAHLCDALTRLSDVAREEGRAAASRSLRFEALAAAQRAIEATPNDRAARTRLAKAQVLVGDIAKETGDLDEARRRYAIAHEQYVRLAAEGPNVRPAQVRLLWSLDRVGSVERSAGNWEYAKRVHAEELNRAKALAAQWPDDHAVIYAYASALGQSASYLVAPENDPAGADAAHAQLLALRDRITELAERLVRLQPHDRRYRAMRDQCLLERAERSRAEGNLDTARDLASEALRDLLAMRREDPTYLDAVPTLIAAWSHMCELRNLLGDATGSADAAMEADRVAEYYLAARPDEPFASALRAQTQEQCRLALADLPPQGRPPEAPPTE